MTTMLQNGEQSNSPCLPAVDITLGLFTEKADQVAYAEKIAHHHHGLLHHILKRNKERDFQYRISKTFH